MDKEPERKEPVDTKEPNEQQEQHEPLSKQFLINLYSHHQAIQRENKEKTFSKFKIA